MRHITSSGGVVSKIINHKLYILFITTQKGLLSFPKGHVEGGETPEETAIREIKEEIGLEEVKIIQKLGMITRQGHEPDGGTSQKDIHLFLIKASNYTYQHEEDFVWIEFDKALNQMHSPEEKELLLQHKDIIEQHPSPYFAENDLENQWDETHSKFAGDKELICDDIDLSKQALEYIKPGDIIFEIGVASGRDALLFAKEKKAIIYGVDISDQALDQALSKFQTAGLVDLLKPQHLNADNIISADLPDKINVFYTRFSLNLSDTKTFFLLNEILKKMPVGGYFFVEGKTENDYKIKDGVLVGPNLVKSKDGFLIRVWNENFINQNIIERLRLKLVKMKRKPFTWGDKQGESLYFIAQKVVDYAY